MYHLKIVAPTEVTEGINFITKVYLLDDDVSVDSEIYSILHQDL